MVKCLIFSQLIEILKYDGELLYSAHSSEFLIRNVLLSVLKIIREESLRQTSGVDETLKQNDSLNVIFSMKLKQGIYKNMF